jgi:hypothetical protein
MWNKNPLWGASRIHGELMKLGFDVAQSTVVKYMPRRRSLAEAAKEPNYGSGGQPD